jgi:hypothetical protein
LVSESDWKYTIIHLADDDIMRRRGRMTMSLLDCGACDLFPEKCDKIIIY